MCLLYICACYVGLAIYRGCAVDSLSSIITISLPSRLSISFYNYRSCLSTSFPTVTLCCLSSYYHSVYFLYQYHSW